MMYYPKSEEKMVDFETLTLCISLDTCRSVLIFARLSYSVLSVPGKKLCSEPSSFLKFYLVTPHIVAMDLTSREIRVQVVISCSSWYSIGSIF